MTKTSISVLANNSEDRAAWLQAWEACGREPFAHPDYLELFTSGGKEARCVVARSAQGLAIIPFILRPIVTGTWSAAPSLRDASSPYGYGGPYLHGEVAWDDVWPAFLNWMQSHDVVSMFGRLALGCPPIANLPAGSSLQTESDNIIVDLTRSEDEQWRHYEHKVRKNVKKALRADLRAEVKTSFTDVAEFAKLYESTMDRRGASAFYYFGLEFFSTLATELDGSYVAAEVRDENGSLVSAELVLCSDKYLYSFLGGTSAEAFPKAPNDLLKHAVIDYGRKSGRKGYVLGGGYHTDDGIFRYKKAFDPTGHIPFQRLHLVPDSDAYDSLVAARLDHERSTLPAARLREDFFPSYRSGVTDPSDIKNESRRTDD